MRLHISPCLENTTRFPVTSGSHPYVVASGGQARSARPILLRDDTEEEMPPHEATTPITFNTIEPSPSPPFEIFFLTYALAPELVIDRPAMYQEKYEKQFGSPSEHGPISLRSHLKQAGLRCLRSCSSPGRILAAARSFVPITQWLPRYNLRENLAADLVGGITTGVIHVPAGLAYALIAGVDPVYGLYSACFPAFFYMLFGTSRHCAIGPFAIISLMAGISNASIMRVHGGGGKDVFTGNITSLTPIQVASTLTVAMGVVQFAAGLLHLEFLVSYFSDSLVSGFATGSAVHVLIAQIGDIFGLTGLPKSSGPGYIFMRSWDIILAAVERTNLVVLLISVIAITFLYCGKEYLTPFLKKKGFALPVPYELIVIIIASAVSAAFDFQHSYDVPVIGFIPTGPPTPALPVVAILPDCIIESLGMVTVSIAVHISLSKMYAKKMNYEVAARQELFALGASSMLGGLFSVYPVSAVIGATAVNVANGTKTQLSAFFSCALLLVVILWMGPLLEPLPVCILACVIIVAMKSMFQRTDELKELWRISKTDLAVWIVAFTTTAAIDVIWGLALSILFALLTVIFRSQWPKSERTTVYDDIDTTKIESSLARRSVCVFRFDAPLIFTNAERFMSQVKKTIEDWQAVDMRPSQTPSANMCAVTVISESIHRIPKYFIIDCSSVPYIDYMGVKALTETIVDMRNRGTTLYLVAVRPDVLAVLHAARLLDTISKEQIFPTLRDALYVANINASSAEQSFNNRLFTQSSAQTMMNHL